MVSPSRPRSLPHWPGVSQVVGAEPCSLILSMDVKGTVWHGVRVCVTVGTLKTPGVGSALYRMSSGAQRPFWACPSVRAPGSTWLEAKESSAAAVFAVPDCTALGSGWESLVPHRRFPPSSPKRRAVHSVLAA